jgi:DNA invertase Pin-like site-specific DNA recombinase
MNTEMTLAKYCRISVDDGRFGVSQSIENQRLIIDEYISGHPELGLYRSLEFIDDGISGASLNRPAITKLLDMAKKGEVHCIVVKDFSRFGRDYIDVGDYLEQIFPFLGVRFISVTDGYDSAVNGTLAGDVANGFKNLYNAYYSKDISLKVRMGLLSRKQSGEYTPSRCPYGYKKSIHESHNPNERRVGMEIDEEAASIVCSIFEMKLKGSNAETIADTLNRERIPSPLVHIQASGSNIKGNVKSVSPLWSQGKINLILRDIRYTGFFAYNMYASDRLGDKRSNKLPIKQWVTIPDAIPAIVSTDTFTKAQSNRQDNSAKNRGGKGKQFLARKLVCGGCGYSLARDIKTNTCHCARKTFTENMNCLNGNIEMDVIENVLKAAIQKLADLCDTLKSQNVMNKKGSKELYNAIRGKGLFIKTAKHNKTVLYDRYCDSGITKEEYIILRDAEDDLLRQAESELAELEKQQGELKEHGAVELAKRFSDLNFDGTLTREFIDALVKRVLVHGIDRVEIEWAFKDPFVTPSKLQ